MKSGLLLKGDRLTLIKSVMANTLALISISVGKRLEVIQCGFFLGDSEERRCHLDCKYSMILIY